MLQPHADVKSRIMFVLLLYMLHTNALDVGFVTILTSYHSQKINGTTLSSLTKHTGATTAGQSKVHCVLGIIYMYSLLWRTLLTYHCVDINKQPWTTESPTEVRYEGLIICNDNFMPFYFSRVKWLFTKLLILLTLFNSFYRTFHLRK